MPGRVEEYRCLANECRELAKTLPPGDTRATVMEMAEQWDRLAEQQECATALRLKH